MRIPSWVFPPVLLGSLFLACGGGGGGGNPPAPSFTVAPASLTLPVPPAANVDAAQNYYPAPYSGTATVTVTRSAGFTGAVTLAVAQGSLPTHVKANFANPADTTGLTTLVPGSSTTATLSLQAGYPDPSDPTFTRQFYPTQGSYTIPISASASGVTGTNGSLALSLVSEPADFGLSFATFNANGTISALNTFTNLNLVGTSLSETFTAYWSVGTYTAIGPVLLSTHGVPAGLTVGLDSASINLYQGIATDVHTLTISAQSGLAAGSYSFLLLGSFQGVTHALPVVVTYSPFPFSVQAPLPSRVSVAQGQTLDFPVYLWHNDAFYGTTPPTDGSDPAYVGQTSLSASAPGGLSVAFANPDPTGLAAVPCSVTASPSSIPGTYTVDLLATRIGAAGVPGVTVPAAPFPLTVEVTATGASAPTVWIQNVEWGQTVVAPNLRLVGGKPALLRVQLMADRPGVPAPATFTATVTNGTSVSTPIPLLGPGSIPTRITEGDLPTASGPSASTYTAMVPASVIQPGMRVTIQVTGMADQTLNPSVDPGYALNLVAVPIYCKGVAPVLPSEAVISQELTAFWPVKAVNVTRRAPYTTSTVIPPPGATPLTDTSGDGWIQLLQEIASLRIVDGSTANYYGFFNPSIPATATSSIVGLSPLGDGVGIGIDVTTAGSFPNDDPALDLATTIMVHEEGHAFNLNHAPAGGAGHPQLNYPYYSDSAAASGGAVIGSWGFDPATQTGYDPTRNFDIMSYATATHWVSDWNYLSALGYLGEKETPPVSLGTLAASAPTDQWVVSGMVRPDGQVRLSPLVRVVCAPVPPKAGDLTLVLTSGSATRTILFAATQLPDLPAGYRHFAFTVPAAEELVSAEVQAATGASFKRARFLSLASRTKALAASIQGGGLRVQESAGVLHLAWDPQAHPYVNVFHEGAVRTTLGLHLTGGFAELPVTGLPPGGQFVVHYSDGLNAVIQARTRPSPP